MNKITLTKDEKDILTKFGSGKLKRVKGAQKETRRYKEYANFTLSKPRTINIRLSQKTYNKIKAVAAGKGLSYQTFISSLIHRYSNRE